jgi:tetratricopeptide (TPR) repeat protein
MQAVGVGGSGHGGMNQGRPPERSAPWLAAEREGGIVLTVSKDGRALPAAGKYGVEALRQMPDAWLTFPARDRLNRWLDDRRKRKQISDALDGAMHSLVSYVQNDADLRSLGELMNERFFRDRQVLGTLVACFTAAEPVDYELLMRSVTFGTEQQRRRVLEAFVALLRTQLAGINPEFRLGIPVQSATRMKAIVSAAQVRQQAQKFSASTSAASSSAAAAPPKAPPMPQKHEPAGFGIEASLDPHQNFALAVELEGQGRTEEALAIYEFLLRQKPDFGKAHFNLAMLLVEKGELEEAEQHCFLALQGLHDYPDAWGLQAYLLAALGRQSESLECARRAVSLGFPRKRLASLLKLEPAAL